MSATKPEPSQLDQACHIIAEQGMWLAELIKAYSINPEMTRLISTESGNALTLDDTMQRGLAFCNAEMAIRKAKAGGAA